MTPSSLDGRVVLVTGLSRPQGIAYTLAERMTDLGATVFATGWRAHDAEMPWGSTPFDHNTLRYSIEQRDLALAHEPASLINAVFEQHGTIDIVLAVHARSSSEPLEHVTANELDACWNVNVRSIVLMAQRLVALRNASGTAPDSPGSGRF